MQFHSLKPSGFLSSAVLFFAIHGLAAAALPVYDVIEVKAPDGLSLAIASVNDEGKIACTIFQADGHHEACIYFKGKVTKLGTLGGEHSESRLMNEAGAIAGISQLSDGTESAFLYSKGKLNRIKAPAGVSPLRVTGLNSVGQVLLNGFDAGFNYRAFLYDPVTKQTSEILAGNQTRALSLNRFGQVLVTTLKGSENGSLRYQIYRNGTTTDLEFSEEEFQITSNISAAGAVAGIHTLPDFKTEIFYSRKTVFRVLPSLATAVDTVPVALNGIDQIIANATVPSSVDDRSSSRAIRITGDKVSGLGVLPGYTDSYASVINEAGDVGGDCWQDLGSGNQPSRPFVFRKGKMHEIDIGRFGIPDGGTATGSIWGLNNRSQAIGPMGFWAGPGNMVRSSYFLATPISVMFEDLHQATITLKAGTAALKLADAGWSNYSTSNLSAVRTQLANFKNAIASLEKAGRLSQASAAELTFQARALELALK